MNPCRLAVVQRLVVCRAIALTNIALAATGTMAATADQPASGGELLERTTVFTSGTEGVNSYRIPALVATPPGTLLAFGEARKHSWRDKSPSRIVLKRSIDQGKTWGPTQVIHDVGEGAAMDPCAVVDRRDGAIHLLHVVYPPNWNARPVPGLAPPSCTVWISTSRNDGQTWTAPRDITRQVKQPSWTTLATGPGMGIQWERGPHAGRLVVPIHHGGGEPARGNRLVFSDDGGKTWVCSAGHVEARSDESQIVELATGVLLLNGRGGTNRWHATTLDWGHTWSPASSDPALTEPKGGDGSGCQASVVRYRRAGDTGAGELLFSSPSHPENRANLTIRLSRDEGRSWAVARTLHPQAAGYSCLAVLHDGTIGVLFEGADTPVFSREKGARPAGWMNLLFARFNLAWLESSAKTP